jgi:pSer/pThr/pTyr-binding forkhead associated (FHA) protein/biotin carboxyl carrier protein
VDKPRSSPPPRPPARRPTPSPQAIFDDDDGDDADDEPSQTVPAPANLTIEARLVVEKGDHAGKVLKLGGGTAVIGRSSKCDLSLKGSAGVSRRHCKVQLVGERYVMLDLESRNGTIVNGAALERKILEDGDLIEVGNEHVRFLSTRKPAQAGRAPTPSESVNDQATVLLENGVLNTLELPPDGDDVGDDDPMPGGDPPMVERRAPPPIPPNAPPPAQTQKVARAPRMSVSDDKQPLPASPNTLPGPRRKQDPTTSFVVDPATLEADQRRAAIRRGDDLPPPPPLPLEARENSGGGIMLALVAVAIVVVGVGGVFAWDTMANDGHLVASLKGERREAPAVDAPKAETPPHAKFDDVNDVKAETPPPAKVEDAKVEVAKADTPPPAKVDDVKAEPPPPAKVEEPPPPPPAKVEEPPPPPPPPPPTETVTVTSSATGRVASWKVKPGAKVAKGDVVGFLEGSAGARRKLEALREEEADFASAVKKGNKSAARDLESVRSEIANLEKRTKGAPLVSDQAGTVKELVVKVGDVVKVGAPLFTVEP